MAFAPRQHCLRWSLRRDLRMAKAPVAADELRSVRHRPVARGRAFRRQRSVAARACTFPGRKTSSLDRQPTRGSPANRLAVPVGALLVLFFGVAVLAGLVAAPTTGAPWPCCAGEEQTDGRSPAFVVSRRSCRCSAGCCVGVGVALSAGRMARAARRSRWLQRVAPIARRFGRASGRCRRGRRLSADLRRAWHQRRPRHGAEPAAPGQRCGRRRRPDRAVGARRSRLDLHLVAGPRRRSLARGAARARRDRARSARHQAHPRGAAGVVERQSAALAADQADVGGGHGTAPAVDRHRLADRRHRDVLAADLRLCLDPASRVSRSGRVRRSLRLPPAARALVDSSASGRPDVGLVGACTGHDVDRRPPPRCLGALLGDHRADRGARRARPDHARKPSWMAVELWRGPAGAGEVDRSTGTRATRHDVARRRADDRVRRHGVRRAAHLGRHRPRRRHLARARRSTRSSTAACVPR